MGLGFRVHDAWAFNRVRASSLSSLSAAASESACWSNFVGISAAAKSRAGSCLKPKPRHGVGLTLDSRFARQAPRSCVGRMVGVEANEAFGVVVPAREEVYSDAVRVLRMGHVVAVPTDTLYGLACDARSGDAVWRVYEIKERRLSSPLAICVADVGVVGVYGEAEHLPAGLLDALLPGAVTLLLPRRESGELSPSLNPGVRSIGIRIPDSEFIRGLARSFGGPLALTSANTSSHASSVRVEEFAHLWPQCAFVFDAGTLPEGRAGSTIVDLTQEGVFTVVRSGSVLHKTKEILAVFGLRESSF